MTGRLGRRGRRGTRLGASMAIAVLASGAFLAGSPAGAIPPVETASVPVMVVLDASGSMNQSDAPGPRIDAAKSAVRSLVDGLPADAQVGLMVYGTGTGSTDAEREAGCRDITTLVPVSTVDLTALDTQVDRVTAAGYTPIGNALRAAAAELERALPNQGPRSIVLVSDGEDTCAPPAPCDVATELEQQGVDLVVHTVGFKVDQSARDQLSCIAAATGGTYSDAGDSTQLGQALQTKVDHAITGYQSQGTPVTGADQLSEQAPLLSPGQYLDSLAVGGSDKIDEQQGSTKYYTVPMIEGATMYVSATLAPPARAASSDLWDYNALGLRLNLRAKDNFSCSDNYDFELFNGGNQSSSTVVLAAEVGGPNWSTRCPVDGVGILEVQRTGAAYHDDALPVEIIVRVEPRADLTGVPAAADKGQALPQATHGDQRLAISGGTGFNDAPELTSGLTYVDTLATGGNRYYRIPVEWGQRLNYTITETGPAQPELDTSPIAWVDVFNPVRQDIEMTDWTHQGQGWFAGQQNEPFSAAMPYPARYTNRDSYEQRDFQLDGFYYLRVSADFGRIPSTTSFLLTVQVEGDPEPGPTYRPGPAGRTSSAAPSTTPATSSSASSTPSSAPPATTPASAPPGLAGQSSSDDGPGRLLIVGAGVVLVAGAAVGGTLWWVRRQRRT